MPGGGDHPGPTGNPNIAPPTLEFKAPDGTIYLVPDVNRNGVIDPDELATVLGQGKQGQNNPGTGTGSGSSSGGSSSGGSAPADPNAQLISAASSEYFKLWGQSAPADYVKGLVDGGMNLQEFIDHEKQKPAFRHTKAYHDEASSWAAVLTGILGR